MELKTRAEFYAKVCNVLFIQRGLRGTVKTATRGARHLSLGIRLSNPLGLDTALSLAEPLALAVNCPAVIAQRREDSPGLLTFQFQLQPGLWESYTRADVTGLGVGLGEQRRQINFCFDREPHALIAGETRIAGKTETVRSIMTGLFSTYRPDQLKAVICDAAWDYESFSNVAHLAFPLAHDAEDIDAAIAFAGQQFKHRRENNLRNATPMVVTVDEAETELNQKDFPERFEIIHKIGREAAKFGMHLVISTQKPKAENLGDLIQNLGNRFVGKVTDAPTSARLTGLPGLHCELLTGHGDFLHVSAAIAERLQVAMATEADISKLPRAEITRPEVAEEDTQRILNLPEERGPGRPPNEPEPRAIAHYLWHGDKMSIALAKELLGLSKRAHYLNRDFAAEVRAELIALHNAMKGESTA